MKPLLMGTLTRMHRCLSGKWAPHGMIFRLFFMTCFLFAPVLAHAASDPKIHNSDNLGTKYGVWGTGYTCDTCHHSTANTNIKKVRSSLSTPIGSRPVFFNRYTTGSNVTSGGLGNDERTVNADGSRNVCEVCHHNTMYHQYSSSKIASKTHTEHKSNRKDCTQCHAHRVGFRPPPAGDCTSCHGYPPTQSVQGGPNGIATNALGPTPPADAGAHAKHRLEQGMACATCHNGFGHGLLGNDLVEFGFNVNRTNWPNFEGIVTTGTVTGTNNPAFDHDFAVAPGNPGTTLLRSSAWGASCSIYCHGDNWNVPSGYNRSGPISWTNGPLGDCSNATCHGTSPAYPPTPSIASGAHSRHVGQNQYACSTCHDSYTAPHMVNGKVKWNLSAVSPTATYRGFNISSTATLATTAPYGNCTNIYCHSNVQSGANGDAPATFYDNLKWGGATPGCNGCHGNPMTTGSHTKHTTGYSNRFTCGDCHYGAGRDNEAKHADRNIDVNFSAGYGGSYDQSVNPAGNGYGNCSATYCHSDGNGTTKIIKWGSGSLDCTSCHGGDATSGNQIVSGKHQSHISNEAILGSNYGCQDCHASTVSSNTVLAGTVNHVNRLKDYSAARAGSNNSYNPVTGVCSAAYCHSDGKGAQRDMTAAGWRSTATLDCKGCHGSDSSPAFTSVAGEPNYANTGAGTLRANNHQRHMGGYGITTCVYCHNETMTASGTIIGGSTTHTNGVRNVQAGGGRSFTYDLGTRTCSNISCHGGPLPIQWGSSMPADCTGCHGNNASSSVPQTSGKHRAHMNNYTTLGRNYRCATCHALTINPDDRSIADQAYHGNGFKNFTGALAGGRSGYTTATGVCSATYCHTDGKGQQNVPFTVANGWKSTATLDCKGCHGNDTAQAFASTAGEPNYTNGGAGTLRANNHQNHADTGATSCVFCHADTVGPTGAILANVSTHTNRRIDLKGGNGKSFVWSAAGKTCSNISCHGGKGSFTQSWGNGMTPNCLGCHGNNVASGTPMALGSHTAHINNAAVIGTNFNCTECHAKTINPDERSFANPANHGNGFKDFSGARAGGPGSYSTITGACSATYCHTDGKGSQKDMTTTNWRSAANLDCTGCHGSDSSPAFTSIAGEPNYANTGAGTPRANNHQRHTTGYLNSACVYCHSSTMTSSGTIIGGSTTHTNRYIDVAPGGGRTFTYTPADRTCTNISCHGTGSNSAQWGQQLAPDCSGCHGGNAAAAPNDIKTNKHPQHIKNAGLIGTNYSCAECHAKTVSGDRTISNAANHGNGFVDFSSAKGGTDKSRCNNAYCHSDGKGGQGVAVDWVTGSGFPGCFGCHGTATGPGSFVSVAGEPNYPTEGPGAPRANTHGQHVGPSGAVRCINCHATTVNAAGTAIASGSITHTDKNIDVVPGNGKSFTFTPGTKTCANISCHGVGSVQATWGATMSADCTGCHGGNAAAAPGDIKTNQHGAHINNANVNGENFACSECHARTVSADRAIVSTVNHGNGFVDFSGARAGKNKMSCNTAYCHSDGKGGTGISVDWVSGPVISNCIGCHGADATPAFTSVAGEPNYASVKGTLRANSHRTHAAAGASTCDTCHTATVDASGTAIKAGSRHLDRYIDVVFNTAKATAVWNGVDRTCSNISCHANGNATWGDASTAGCKACHGSLSGSHGIHVGDLLNTGLVTFYNYTADSSSGSTYRFGCANCHPTDPLKHRNGTVEVTIASNKPGASNLTKLNTLVTTDTGGYTRNGANSLTCETVYCHSNGKNNSLSLADYRQTPDWYGGTFGTNRCGSCHDNPPQYAGQSHYNPASTIGDNGRGASPPRETGHMVGIHYMNTYAGNKSTGFLGFSSNGNKAHGNSGLATTISCYICHSGIVDGTVIDTYAMTGTSSDFRCSNCHSGSTRTPLQVGQIANTALHVNGRKDVAFSPSMFKTKAQLANVANALGWTRNGNYKAADSFDSFDLSVATWDPATKTCLTSCHVNQPNITWGAQLKCVSCHANQ